MSDYIKKLTDLFAKFPTIGQRTANRFVFYLLRLPKEKIDELTDAIQKIKSTVKFCSFCFQPFEPLEKEGLCSICSDPKRNKQILCIVEKETDLISIESKKKYNGLFFILGGNILSIKKSPTNGLRLEELKERVKSSPPKEIIIATNPTPEGKATSVLVEKKLKELPDSGWKITYLATGLPVGGELEYADEETLKSAFEGRK